MEFTYIVIISNKKNLRYIIKNIKYFNYCIVFNNTGHELKDKRLQNVHLVNVPMNYLTVESYSELRNWCLKHLEIGKKYIFLDDDEEIIQYQNPYNIQYSKIYINDFPSNVRIFTLDKKLHYVGKVHEELNINTELIINFKVKHHIDITTYQTKIRQYAQITDSPYYKIRNYLWLNIEWTLSKKDIELLKFNINTIYLLMISKRFFNFSHGISDLEYQNIIKKIDISLIESKNRNIIKAIKENRDISVEDILEQTIYQNKFQLLQNM